MGSPVLHNERIRRTLAKNLKAFLVHAEISENQLAQKCKISQKQVNNVTNARTGCGIDALVEMGHVFSVEPWVLLVDGANDAAEHANHIARVVASYLKAGDNDRELIDAVIRKVSS